MASIKKIEGKNGVSYKITVSCGYDVKGKKLIETATFKPDAGLTPKKMEKAAQDFAHEFESRVKSGAAMDGRKVTLQVFADRWIEEYAKPKLQPGTVKKYREELEDKILPAIGHYKLSEIKPHTVNAFFLSLTKDGARKDGKAGGYSKGSITKTRNVLSSILRTATEWEIIDRNPCDKVSYKLHIAVSRHGERSTVQIFGLCLGQLADKERIGHFLKLCQSVAELLIFEKLAEGLRESRVAVLVSDLPVTGRDLLFQHGAEPLHDFHIAGEVSENLRGGLVADSCALQLDELQGVADSHGVVSGLLGCAERGNRLAAQMLNNATRRSIQCRRFLSSCGQQSGLVFLVDLAEMFRRVGFLLHVLFVLLIQRPDIVGKALL